MYQLGEVGGVTNEVGGNADATLGGSVGGSTGDAALRGELMTGVYTSG